MPGYRSEKTGRPIHSLPGKLSEDVPATLLTCLPVAQHLPNLVVDRNPAGLTGLVHAEGNAPFVELYVRPKKSAKLARPDARAVDNRSDLPQVVGTRARFACSEDRGDLLVGRWKAKLTWRGVHA